MRQFFFFFLKNVPWNLKDVGKGKRKYLTQNLNPTPDRGGISFKLPIFAYVLCFLIEFANPFLVSLPFSVVLHEIIGCSPKLRIRALRNSLAGLQLTKACQDIPLEALTCLIEPQNLTCRGNIAKLSCVLSSCT